jgi:uncharacterized protein
MLPSKTECLCLLHAAGCSSRVIAHSIVVCELSIAIADSINSKTPGLVSLSNIEVGALLHDIGRSAIHSIHHACAGAAICRSHQIDLKICDIVLHHIGAGISSSEARELGLPPVDYMPISLEEKIVAHADNVVMGKEIVSLRKRIKRAKDDNLPSAAIKRMIKLHNEINGLCVVPVEKLGMKKAVLKKRIKKRLQDAMLNDNQD